VAQRLQAHPGVEVLVRDRAEAYAEAARAGAPAACQVADRFHLLQHLAAALTQVFTAHPAQLACVNVQPTAVPTPVHAPVLSRDRTGAWPHAARTARAVQHGGGPGPPAAHPAVGSLSAGEEDHHLLARLTAQSPALAEAVALVQG
jgi:hypothetical protein